MTFPAKNQAPKQQKLKDLNEIKQLKTNSRLKAVNLVIGECLYFKDNYYQSEATIAKRLNIGASTVYRAIRDAYNLGLISKRRRFNNSNVYAINPELRNPQIIDELASILPALRGILCLIMLIPLVALCKPAPSISLLDRDQLNKKNEILRTILVVHRCTKNEETYGSLAGTRPQRDQKSLKGDSRSMENKAHTYGGTNLYDRKTSQYEIDLLARARSDSKKKYGMQIDDEAQPRYNEEVPSVQSKPIPEGRKKAYNANTPYAPYEHKCRPAEDPVAASERLINWTQDPERYNKFVAIVGEEVARKMCNKIVSNALQEMK